MADLKGYRCPNCGNMLPISQGRVFKCQYCGSEFEKQDDYLKPLMVETCEAKLVTLVAKRNIPDMFLRDDTKEEVIEMSLKHISQELAEHIIPYMEIKTYKDMQTMTTVVAGKIRVAEPNSRMYRQFID